MQPISMDYKEEEIPVKRQNSDSVFSNNGSNLHSVNHSSNNNNNNNSNNKTPPPSTLNPPRSRKSPPQDKKSFTSKTEAASPPTPPVSFLSLEFLLPSILTFTVEIVGAVQLYRVFRDAVHHHVNDFKALRAPLSPFRYLGSVGFDYSDGQYRMTYQLLAVYLTALAVLAVAMQAVAPRIAQWCPPLSVGTARSVLSAVSGLLVVGVLLGPDVFLLLFLIALNYVVFFLLPQQLPLSPLWFQVFLWGIHVPLIPAVEMYGERFSVGGYFPRWPRPVRWVIMYRMTSMRLIAFAYDSWEARHQGSTARDRAMTKHTTSCIQCAEGIREARDGGDRFDNDGEIVERCRCYKLRTDYSRELCDYNVLNYIAYVLYPPLFLSGPMMSFNGFVSYLHVPCPVLRRWRTLLWYTVRIIGLAVVHVTLLHYIFVCLATDHQYTSRELSLGLQLHCIVYFLSHLWMKLTFIWRVARLMSILSGVEPPEDMRRCFGNTLTVQDFWKDWHASFNLWIVRYMYIPMGGKARIMYSLLPIFLFIAIWHDPALHLIKWALCICVSFILELLVQFIYERYLAAPIRQEMNLCRHTADEETTPVLSEFNTTTNVAGEAGSYLSHNSSNNNSNSFSRHGLKRKIAMWLVKKTDTRRGQLYRMLRSIGGGMIIVGLVIGNIIGFNHQSAEGDPSDKSVTDKSMMALIRKCDGWMWLILIAMLYSFASVAGIQRDRDRYRDAMKKRRYGLL